MREVKGLFNRTLSSETGPPSGTQDALLFLLFEFVWYGLFTILIPLIHEHRMSFHCLCLLQFVSSMPYTFHYRVLSPVLLNVFQFIAFNGIINEVDCFFR